MRPQALPPLLLPRLLLLSHLAVNPCSRLPGHEAFMKQFADALDPGWLADLAARLRAPVDTSAMALDAPAEAAPDSAVLAAALASAKAAAAVSATALSAGVPDAAVLAAALAVAAAVALSAARAPAPAMHAVAASTSSTSAPSALSNPMDMDRRLRRAEKRPRKEDAHGFQLPLWEARAAENQRLIRLPAPPPPIVALPAPEALPALPAPLSEEEMIVDPEAERRKRPREEMEVYNVQPASVNEGAGAQSREQEDSEAPSTATSAAR